MNENRERGHGSAQLLAVALSSQNVSRVASVARKRACFSFSNSRRRFSAFRETSSSKPVSFASFVARRPRDERVVRGARRDDAPKQRLRAAWNVVQRVRKPRPEQFRRFDGRFRGSG
jgi:hypothetical protein